MKKFLSAILMVAMGVCAQAQIVSSSSSRVVRVVEKKPVKEEVVEEVISTPFDVSHYVKWGANLLDEMTPSGGVYFLWSSFGWHLMYGTDRPFWQKEGKNVREGTYSCLYWGYEAGMVTRGFSLDGYNIADLCDDQGNHWPDYDQIKRIGLQVAPKIGFKWGGPDDGLGTIALGAEVGFYTNYNVKSSYSLGEYTMGISTATSDLLMNAFFDAWSNFETGISAGIFGAIGPMRLDIRYVGGLVPSFSGVDCKPVEGYYIPPVSATYNSMYVSLGVEF